MFDITAYELNKKNYQFLHEVIGSEMFSFPVPQTNDIMYFQHYYDVEKHFRGFELTLNVSLIDDEEPQRDILHLSEFPAISKDNKELTDLLYHLDKNTLEHFTDYTEGLKALNEGFINLYASPKIFSDEEITSLTEEYTTAVNDFYQLHMVAQSALKNMFFLPKKVVSKRCEQFIGIVGNFALDSIEQYKSMLKRLAHNDAQTIQFNLN